MQGAIFLWYAWMFIICFSSTLMHAVLFTLKSLIILHLTIFSPTLHRLSLQQTWYKRGVCVCLCVCVCVCVNQLPGGVGTVWMLAAVAMLMIPVYITHHTTGFVTLSPWDTCTLTLTHTHTHFWAPTYRFWCTNIFLSLGFRGLWIFN